MLQAGARLRRASRSAAACRRDGLRISGRRKRASDVAPRVGADAWSVMLYTSGTTARPKGCRVAITPSAPPRSLMSRRISMRHRERTLGAMPLYHTMGVRSLLAMSLIGGAFVCLPRFDSRARSN